jgi:hypothetical protein
MVALALRAAIGKVTRLLWWRGHQSASVAAGRTYAIRGAPPARTLFAVRKARSCVQLVCVGTARETRINPYRYSAFHCQSQRANTEHKSGKATLDDGQTNASTHGNQSINQTAVRSGTVEAAVHSATEYAWWLQSLVDLQCRVQTSLVTVELPSGAETRLLALSDSKVVIPMLSDAETLLLVRNLLPVIVLLDDKILLVEYQRNPMALGRRILENARTDASWENSPSFMTRIEDSAYSHPHCVVVSEVRAMPLGRGPFVQFTSLSDDVPWEDSIPL